MYSPSSVTRTVLDELEADEALDEDTEAALLVADVLADEAEPAPEEMQPHKHKAASRVVTTTIALVNLLRMLLFTVVLIDRLPGSTSIAFNVENCKRMH